ncbi:MAG: alcohol dehydrogenase catalytic domain-containing protein [Puniceicoccaceae bacterium]
MKAILLNEPGQFEQVELPEPDPASLGEDEALVQICHVGLCGTDIHAYHGNQPFFSYPRILGHELGVEVIATGGEHGPLQPGTRCCVEAYLCEPGDQAYRRGKTNCTATTKCLGVHVDGGMRERMVLPVDKLHPSKLSTRDLALVEPLCIGHHAVERAALLGDEIVAVIGLGPIGLGVVQFALLQGVQVVAMDISAERLATCAKFYPGIRTLQVDSQRTLLENWEQGGLELPEVV